MNNYQLPPSQYGYAQQQPPCNCANRVPRSEVNAVKIELINPQAYGGAQAQAPVSQPVPAPMMAPPPPTPMMAPPLAQAPVYSYPQAPIYPQMQEMGPMMPPPYIPQQPMPMMPMNQQINNPPMPPTPPAEQFVPQQPVDPTPPAAVVDQAEAPQVPPMDNQPQSQLDIAPIVDSLKSPDLEQQFGAIQKIAEIGQQKTPDADALINEEIFQNLAAVVDRDTTQMPGPTGEQIQLREQKFSGAQLSPEQDQIAETLSPQELAEMNKQYATYTLAVMQNNFRDTVNVEAQKQGLEPVKLNEIPEINTVIENVKSNPNPLIREASISALSYVAKPEDKEPLGLVFALAQDDADPMVQEAASKAIDKINQN